MPILVSRNELCIYILLPRATTKKARHSDILEQYK